MIDINEEGAAMSTLSRRRRAIFTRRNGHLPIIRAAILSLAFIGVGGAGFAAGLKVGSAERPAAEQNVKTVSIWPSGAPATP